MEQQDSSKNVFPNIEPPKGLPPNYQVYFRTLAVILTIAVIFSEYDINILDFLENAFFVILIPVSLVTAVMMTLSVHRCVRRAYFE